MNADQTPAPDGVQAQVLIELGKLSTGQAVANTKLDSLLVGQGDHETRIRALEQTAAEHQGGRDVWARIIAAAAVLAGAGGIAVQFIHHP